MTGRRVLRSVAGQGSGRLSSIAIKSFTAEWRSRTFPSRPPQDGGSVKSRGPPLDRFRNQYSNHHYNGPNQANRPQHQINREFIKEEKDFPAVQCFDRALEFLDNNRDADNWMLHLECFDPHGPFYAPERLRKSLKTDYEGPILDWPKYAPVSESEDEVAEILSNYAALVAMCDEYFGKLLGYFDAHDLWKDTCLILTTDHGYLSSELMPTI